MSEPKEPILFDANNAGIGDIVLLSWMAEGLKREGHTVRFQNNRHRGDIFTVLGQEVVTQGPNALNMTQKPDADKKALGYHYELRVTRGRVSRPLAWFSSIGKACTPVRPTLTITEAETADAATIVKDRFKGSPFVVLAPFCSWKPREWPYAYWLDYAYALNGKGVKVLGIGAHSEENAKLLDKLPDKHWLTGYSWGTLAAVLKQATHFVGNDSGPTHFAGTVGVPGFALCGPTKNIFDMYSCIEEVRATPEQASCVGCYFEGAKGYRVACDHSCRALLSVTPEQLVEKTLQRIEMLRPTIT